MSLVKYLAGFEHAVCREGKILYLIANKIIDLIPQNTLAFKSNVIMTNLVEMLLLQQHYSIN